MWRSPPAVIPKRAHRSATVLWPFACRPGEAPSLWSRTVDRPGGRFWSKVLALALAVVLTVVALWRWRRHVKLRRRVRDSAMN